MFILQIKEYLLDIKYFFKKKSIKIESLNIIIWEESLFLISDSNNNILLLFKLK